MYCEWLDGRLEIYFALYFFARQSTLPLMIEYIRAVKYGIAILPDGTNLETTPPKILPKVDISLHHSCMANNSTSAMLNIQHEVDVELTKVGIIQLLQGDV